LGFHRIKIEQNQMSAIGPNRTNGAGLLMSAFEGEPENDLNRTRLAILTHSGLDAPGNFAPQKRWVP